MAENTEDQILENALAPKRVAGDEGSVEQHPIADQIVAVQYAAGRAASRRGRTGIRYFQFRPPDGTGVDEPQS